VSTKNAITYAKQTYSRWSDHHAPRLGASVAFYSILSFAPLLVLITGIIALVFGHESAHGALVNEARQVIGDRGADTVDSLLKNAQKPGSGIFSSVVAFITLLFGASGVFAELQDALNIMWDVPEQSKAGFMGLIKQRLFSFGMILSVGFLLLVSLLLSTGLAYVGHAFGQLVTFPPAVLELLNFVLSFVVITVLFALMFKYVPSVHVHWRDVIVGAIGTALLFTIGKFLLGLYLGKASVGSTYGAAGSLVAVVVWIYYSAQIFFFGAEFTRIYADAHHGRTAPTQKATPKEESADTLVPATAQKAMGAAAGAGYGAQVPASAPPAHVTAAHVMAAPVVLGISPPVQNSLATPPGAVHATLPKPNKPRLLMAAAFGFFVGRATWALQQRSRR